MVYPSTSTPYFERKIINNIITIITKAGNHNLVLLNKKLIIIQIYFILGLNLNKGFSI